MWANSIQWRYLEGRGLNRKNDIKKAPHTWKEASPVEASELLEEHCWVLLVSVILLMSPLVLKKMHGEGQLYLFLH